MNRLSLFANRLGANPFAQGIPGGPMPLPSAEALARWGGGPQVPPPTIRLPEQLIGPGGEVSVTPPPSHLPRSALPPQTFQEQAPTAAPTVSSLPPPPLQSSGETQLAGPPELAGGPMYVPAHRDVTQIPYSPKTLEKLDKAQAQMAEAQEAESRELAIGAHLRAESMAEQARELQDQALLHKATELERQKAAKAQRDTAQAILDEASSRKIDPDRLFAKADTGTKMLMVIGGALGGALSGLQGGPNQFVAHLDRMIDRDVDAQRMEIQQARYKGEQAMNMLDAIERSGLDERTSEQTLRMMQMQTAQQHLDAQAEQTRSAALSKRGAEISAALEQWRAQHAAKLDEMSYVGAQAIGPAGGLAGGKPPEMGSLVNTAFGEQRVAASEKEGAELRDMTSAVQTITDKLDRAIVLRNQLNPVEWASLAAGVGVSERVRELKQLSAELPFDLTKQQDKSVVRESERPLYQAIASITAIGPGATATIGHAKEHFQGAYRRAVDAKAPHKTSELFMRHPRTGELVPRAYYTGQKQPQKLVGKPKSFRELR